MKALINLAWLIDLALIAVFIVSPTYSLVISDNHLTAPDEIKAAVLMIVGGLLILSPITYVLNGLKKAVNGK